MLKSLFYAIIQHDTYAFKQYDQKKFVNDFFVNISNNGSNSIPVYTTTKSFNDFLINELVKE